MSNFEPEHPIYTAHESILEQIVRQTSPELRAEARAIMLERLGRPLLPLGAGAGRRPPARGAGRPPIVRTTRRRCVPADPVQRRARLDNRVALGDLQHLPRSIGRKLRHAGKAICAVLAIVAAGNPADRHRRGGRVLRAVELTLQEIADRSHTSPSTVRATIDALESMGVVRNEDDRKRPDGKNLPNRVVIVCRAWLAWLAKRYGIGSFFPCAIGEKDLNLLTPGASNSTNAPDKAALSPLNVARRGGAPPSPA